MADRSSQTAPSKLPPDQLFSTLKQWVVADRDHSAEWRSQARLAAARNQIAQEKLQNAEVADTVESVVSDTSVDELDAQPGR